MFALFLGLVKNLKSEVECIFKQKNISLFTKNALQDFEAKYLLTDFENFKTPFLDLF